MVLTVTGNICSGKSTILSYFNYLGINTINMDEISKEVLTYGQVRSTITEWYGEEILDLGTIDTNKLAKIVFYDDLEMKKLVDLTRPFIANRLSEIINDMSKDELLVIEAPLLFEYGDMAIIKDNILLVTCDDEIRLERLMKRDGYDKEYALKRMSKQMSQKEKIDYCKKHGNPIIDTSDCSLDEIADQVDEIIKQWRIK